MIDTEMKKRIDRDFQYHAPVDGQVPMYTAIRAKAKELALLVAELCPITREQSLALTKIEEAVMHANSAIARNTWVVPVDGVDTLTA